MGGSSEKLGLLVSQAHKNIVVSEEAMKLFLKVSQDLLSETRLKRGVISVMKRGREKDCRVS